MKKFKPFMLLVILILFGIFSCASEKKISGKFIEITFNEQMHSQLINKYTSGENQTSNFQPSEFVIVNGKKIQDFMLSDSKTEALNDKIGTGKKITLTGTYQNETVHIQKRAEFRSYDDFPDMLFAAVTYKNMGLEELTFSGWGNHNYSLAAEKSAAEPAFWSFQSGSYENRPDWVLPLPKGFEQQNFMGMNDTDYGGGTPVVDVWGRDGGIAVGHIEMVPKLVSLPVSRDSISGSAHLAINLMKDTKVKSGESYSTLNTFVSTHKNDYFHTLAEYRRFMDKQGIEFKEFPESAYEPIWCAWGYRRDFTMEQIYGTIPKVKEIGYKWFVLDDGWQTAEGDWFLNPDKFPNGDKDMRKLVDKIHAEGLKAKLWWAPLAVDPGTELIKNHPEYLLLNEDGSTQDISWWNSYYLCPAVPEVQQYTKKLVEKIMTTWDWDGLKIDGQHLNAAPPCYNPAHHHAYPEESFEKIPEFFKVIYETARKIKPDAVVEICPCGTAYAFHTMPYMNQPVASDPTSSWQIRLKGKTMKALMGPSAPYYGDHVELSDGKDDFASTVGIGGVIGTKFTWPKDPPPDPKRPNRRRRSNLLTPEKEKVWKNWFNVYSEQMLPKGKYLGELYDIGFDKPETHAIQKDRKMYYAFYADNWAGKVELRGLENQEYKIIDYVNNKDYGFVMGPNPKLDIKFERNLLLMAIPK